MPSRGVVRARGAPAAAARDPASPQSSTNRRSC